MKKAFTLAEVLITIVVIGIVAAITINIIISNQEESYRTGLKKNFSVLQQMFKNAVNDNGGFFPVSYDADPNVNVKQMTNVLLKKYLKVGKDCSSGFSGCFRSKDVTIYNLNGDHFFTYDNSGYPGSVILQDGTFVYIYSSSTSSVTETINSILLMVDVNGIYKKPNRIGKDIFFLQYNVKQDRLIPGGALGNSSMNICDKSSTNAWNGAGCAAKILNNEKLPK